MASCSTENNVIINRLESLLKLETKQVVQHVVLLLKHFEYTIKHNNLVILRHTSYNQLDSHQVKSCLIDLIEKPELIPITVEKLTVKHR